MPLWLALPLLVAGIAAVVWAGIDFERALHAGRPAGCVPGSVPHRDPEPELPEYLAFRAADLAAEARWRGGR